MSTVLGCRPRCASRKLEVEALHEPDLRELVSVARRKLKRDSSQIQNDRRLGQRAEKKGNLRSVLNLQEKFGVESRPLARCGRFMAPIRVREQVETTHDPH